MAKKSAKFPIGSPWRNTSLRGDNPRIGKEDYSVELVSCQTRLSTLQLSGAVRTHERRVKRGDGLKGQEQTVVSSLSGVTEEDRWVPTGFMRKCWESIIHTLSKRTGHYATNLTHPITHYKCHGSRGTCKLSWNRHCLNNLVAGALRYSQGQPQAPLHLPQHFS